MRDAVRAREYRDRDAVGGHPRLTVGETRAGHRGVRIDIDARGPVLDAEATEQLGIDLQIRASYLRGVAPPTGPEPDPAPGPDDVPLILVSEETPDGQ